MLLERQALHDILHGSQVGALGVFHHKRCPVGDCDIHSLLIGQIPHDPRGKPQIAFDYFGKAVEHLLLSGVAQ